MKFIGLLMIAHENDILHETLSLNVHFLDSFYVLDGTDPNDESRAICESFRECDGYLTDKELPRPPYPEITVCGYRQALYEMAVRDHGWDNWFVLIHGDEVWVDPPSLLVAAHPAADGFVCRLPFFFPREGEPWDDRHPLEQLHWRLGPGYPEFRMFKGNPDVRYEPDQRYNTRPLGLTNVVETNAEILHYLYRSPEVQKQRAERHLISEFDLDNYRHVLDGHVYWTAEMISAAMGEHYTVLTR